MISRIGVAEIPTDPMPMDIADSYIILEKDKSKWTSADSKEELIEKNTGKNRRNTWSKFCVHTTC
jgi:cobalt-zinc-cadmium resistance protein CzcA